MNKYQEALDTLLCKAHTNHEVCEANKCTKDESCLECDVQKAFEKLQELVEKATPKKPIQLSDSRRHKCPNCNCQLPFKKNVLKKQNPRIYCDRCGQRIDWSDEE